MVYNIITLPVSLFFIFLGCLQLLYAIILKKRYPKEHNFNNSIIVVVLWIVTGVLYPFFYSKYSENIEWFQMLSTFFICVVTPFILFLILSYQYLFVSRGKPELKERRSLEAFIKEFNKTKGEIRVHSSHNIFTDVYRKSLHLLPAGIIILLYIFAVYIWAGMWGGDQIWGITGEDFGRFLVLTVGMSGVLLFAGLDYLRLSYIFDDRSLYHLLPDVVSNLLAKSLKENEIYEFAKSTALCLAFVPIFLFPIGIFAASALIAAIGDAAASLFGLKFGKRNFPKKSGKTILGYIAGFLASFGVSFLALWIFESNLETGKIIILSFGGAFMFLIIDIWSPKIDDNILNPICCAIAIGVLYYLL